MDMAIVSMPTLTPLVCSDLKLRDSQQSENETALHAVNCINVQGGVDKGDDIEEEMERDIKETERKIEKTERDIKETERRIEEAKRDNKSENLTLLLRILVNQTKDLANQEGLNQLRRKLEGPPPDDLTWPLVLGISGTPTTIALHCFVPVNEVMWRTKIFECTPDSVPFLCTLFCAVKHLIKERIFSRQPIEVYQPLQDKMFEVVHPYKPGVFKLENMLYKLYDSKDECQRRHNIDLLSKLLPHHELQPLSNDKRFSLLSRPFIDGNHEPNQLSDFVGAVTCLKKVHDLGYIHADVQLNNIIFSDGKSHLIDFDLAVLAEPNQRYPPGYCSHIEERHSDAIGGYTVKKEHDIHSMQKIISMFFNIEKCETIEEILAIVSN